MVKLMLTLALSCCALGGSPSTPVFNSVAEPVSVEKKESPAKTKTTHKRSSSKSFLGFKLMGSCDTNVSDALTSALVEYDGPSTGITSLRRKWGTKSRHEHGKAVDFMLSYELAEWLVSEAGKAWLDKFNLMFYLEGKPGSKVIRKYEKEARFKPFVFYNPDARGKTGDHIHVSIK